MSSRRFDSGSIPQPIRSRTAPKPCRHSTDFGSRESFGVGACPPPKCPTYVHWDGRLQSPFWREGPYGLSFGYYRSQETRLFPRSGPSPRLYGDGTSQQKIKGADKLDGLGGPDRRLGLPVLPAKYGGRVVSPAITDQERRLASYCQHVRVYHPACTTGMQLPLST